MPTQYRYENQTIEIADSVVCDLCGRVEPITDTQMDVPKGFKLFMLFDVTNIIQEFAVCDTCLTKKAPAIDKFLKGETSL